MYAGVNAQKDEMFAMHRHTNTHVTMCPHSNTHPARQIRLSNEKQRVRLIEFIYCTEFMHSYTDVEHKCVYVWVVVASIL